MYLMRFINATAFIRRMSKVKLVAIIILIIALCAGTAIGSSEANVTSVFVDNEEYRVFSLSDNAREIIERAGVKLTGENELVLDYFTPGKRGSIIIVAEPHQVQFYEKDKPVATVTTAGTVDVALKKTDIVLKKGDKLSYDPLTGITSDMRVDIIRAFPVTVIADGEEKVIRTTACTVAELLERADIALGENDTVSHKITKSITRKTRLTVKRVEYKTVKETAKTPYDTVVEYDDSMYENQKKVKKEGKKGKTVREYYKTYVDGKETESELLSETVIKEPESEIIIRGTKVRSTGFTGASVKSGTVMSVLTPKKEIELNKNGRPTEYIKVITGKATAYCTGTITSTGVRPLPGRVAVDPREIPYGTKMYIVSSDGRWNYGYSVAADTGGFIYNSSTVVDLYMYSYRDCMTFGRRNVDIYILEWG